MLIEDRRPRQPVVSRLPDAAVVDADVEHVRLLHDAGRADRSSAAKATDGAPSHVAVERGVDGLRMCGRRGESEKHCREVFHSAIIRSGRACAVTGIVIGCGLASALAQLLRGMLFAVAPADPLVFTAVPIMLILTAAAATAIPALQAARVDPMPALRAE